MSILGQVREPIIPPPNGSTPGSNPVAANSQDQFDSYLTKLQTICSENGDPSKANCTASAGAGVAPKTALQAYNAKL